MGDKLDHTGSLEFSAAPLIEVALKRVPRHHIPVSLNLVTRIWEELRSEFTRILGLEGIEQPPVAFQNATFDAFETTGCRFVNDEMGVTVTLQTDLLVVRWVAADGKEYPRFSSLQDVAERVIRAINKHSIQEFRTVVVNLAYANRLQLAETDGVTAPQPWPLSPDWTPSSIFATKQPMELTSAFRSEDGIDRKLTLQLRTDAVASRDWYLFLTVAGAQVPEGSDSIETENNVHSALVKWYPTILSKEAKVAFGMKN
ncbi:MAG: hypothetical protein ACK5UR_07665 [Armatimonadota bacterium]|jgi:uncharacterized protein (TIGR04255 family)|nr:hypothetical protein [Fimbriimonadaceae bacterium]